MEFNNPPNPSTKTLQTQLENKEKQLKAFEEKYEKLLEDFNYNVNLIYERDKEIEDLNRKIDDLLMVNREKDIQLVSMQSLYTRLKRLEADKTILTGRVEALLGSANIPRPGSNQRPGRRAATPGAEELSGARLRGSSADRKSQYVKPLSRINSDLEKRIQALEQEGTAKKEPGITRENVYSKEREISELIKSLSPYKRESNKTLSCAEGGMESFLSDVKKIRESISCSGSRGSYYEEEVKHMPVIRSMYSYEKPR